MRIPMLCAPACLLMAKAFGEPVDLVANGSFEEVRSDRSVDWACDVWSGPAAWSVSREGSHAGRRCLQCASETG